MNESHFRISGLLNSWVAYCNNSRVIPAIMPIICLLFQTTFIQRLTYFYPHQLTQQPVPVLIVALLFMVPPLLLLMRRKYPDQILIVQLLVLVCAHWLDLSKYFVLPILLAVYTVVARSKVSHASILTLFSAAVYLFTMNGEETFSLGAAIPNVTTFAVAVLMGLISRALWTQYQNHQLQIASQAQALKTQLEAQKISAQNRIAAQLHDSVGHDLTALITLSESLLDNDGTDNITEVPQDTNSRLEIIKMINNLARKGLADTRKAVDALNDPGSFPHEIHRLDDIYNDIATLSSLNIPLEMHENGVRNLNQHEEDLLYHIIREALTNALKHSIELQSITINLTYGMAHIKPTTLRILSTSKYNTEGSNPSREYCCPEPRNSIPDSPIISSSFIKSCSESHIVSQQAKGGRMGGLERLKIEMDNLNATMTYGFLSTGSDNPSGTKSALDHFQHSHKKKIFSSSLLSATHFKTPYSVWEVYAELPAKQKDCQ